MAAQLANEMGVIATATILEHRPLWRMNGAAVSSMRSAEFRASYRAIVIRHNRQDICDNVGRQDQSI